MLGVTETNMSVNRRVAKKDGRLALGPLDSTLGETCGHCDHLPNDKS